LFRKRNELDAERAEILKRPEQMTYRSREAIELAA